MDRERTRSRNLDRRQRGMRPLYLRVGNYPSTSNAYALGEATPRIVCVPWRRPSLAQYARIEKRESK